MKRVVSTAMKGLKGPCILHFIGPKSWRQWFVWGGDTQLDQKSPEETCGSAWRIRKLVGGAAFAEPETIESSTSSAD